jgi:predicted SAM-dependent methyltransferase
VQTTHGWSVKFFGAPVETEGWQQLARKVRLFASHRFIRGQGLEIGALHDPLPTFHHAVVRYVDSLGAEERRRTYPEVADQSQVKVDLIDDIERLTQIADASVDFVIANHVLEHCHNPIAALHTMLRVIRKDGVIYFSVPDKRFTFDRERAITAYQHLVRDFREGSVAYDREHYLEWCAKVHNQPGEALSDAELERAHPNIHFHVWTQTEILQLLLNVRRDFGLAFEVEFFAKNGAEVVVVLRKAPTIC